MVDGRLILVWMSYKRGEQETAGRIYFRHMGCMQRENGGGGM